MRYGQWWWKGPFKLTTSRFNIKHFDWIQNIWIVYTLMSKNYLRQAVDTRQLAKENTFNTSFSSNADRQTPLQVHIIQIHSMISQFCAFEARMQPSKRFLYMLLLQLILKKCKCSDWNQDLTEKSTKELPFLCWSFHDFWSQLNLNFEVLSNYGGWSWIYPTIQNISCNIKYILQY